MTAWSYLGRYRGRLVIGSALLLATSALALAIPYLLGRTIDALRGQDPAGEVPTLAMMMIGLAGAQAVTRIGSRVLLFNAARGLSQAAAGACANVASRYGPVRVTSVRQTSYDRVKVYGYAQRGYRTDNWDCTFRSDGRISDFDI